MEGQQPFFTRLRELSIHVEDRVKGLKKELSQPFGQNPQHYDRGLNRIKKDIRELKELSQEVDGKVSSLSKFSRFLQDATEKVNEKTAAIQEIEEYFAQYGYVIPPNSEGETGDNNNRNTAANPTTITITTPTPTHEAGRGKRVSDDYRHLTPELSECGQMVLENKELPILSTIKKTANAPSHLSTQTPTTSRIPRSYDSFSSTSTSISTVGSAAIPCMLMEDWMAGGNMGGADGGVSLDITPEVIASRPSQSKKLLTTNTTNSERLFDTPTSASTAPAIATTTSTAVTASSSSTTTAAASGQGKRRNGGKGVSSCASIDASTPTEPSLSELALQLLGKGNGTCNNNPPSQLERDATGSSMVQHTAQMITTPEEPVLISQHNPLLSSFRESQPETPEEPVLVFTDRLLERETPEEPTLSYPESLPYRMKLQESDVDAPKEPVLTYRQSRDVEVPKEPVLSYRQSRDADVVPKEPVLSYRQDTYENQGTPEEPVLHFYREDQEETQRDATPEEPQLSYQDSPLYRAARASRGDVPQIKESYITQQQRSAASYGNPPSVMNSMDENSEIPRTPELSEVTRSLLSFRIGLQGQTQTQAQTSRDHNHQEHHHTDHRRPSNSNQYKRGQNQPSHDHHQESSHGHSKAHGHRESHDHRKHGQSFSEVMKQLNRTDDDDENVWDDWAGTKQQQQQYHHHHRSTSSAVSDKFRDEVDKYQECRDIPPSPQLSDITQKILGQMRRY